MTGSLQEKANVYYVVLRYKNCEGQWDSKWVSTGLTVSGSNKRKAAAMVQPTIEDHRYLEKVHSRDMQFKSLVLDWLDYLAISDDDEVTIGGYERTAQKHIIPYFEERGLTVAEITSKVIEDYYIFKRKHGRLDGKGGLAQKSLKQHQAVLKACDNPVLYPMIKLTVFFGFRRSELAGLKWSAIDFGRKTIRVQHTVVMCDRKVVRKDKTKSLSSRRTYPFMDDVLSILNDVKKQQARNRKRYGKAYQESDYVFTWSNGEPIRPDYISKAWRNMLKRIGFRHIRWHDLRHTCASLLLALGYSLKDIMEWLGHSDIKTTQIYAHLEVGRKQTMAEEFENKLNSLPSENNPPDGPDDGTQTLQITQDGKVIRVSFVRNSLEKGG